MDRPSPSSVLQSVIAEDRNRESTLAFPLDASPLPSFIPIIRHSGLSGICERVDTSDCDSELPANAPTEGLKTRRVCPAGRNPDREEDLDRQGVSLALAFLTSEDLF